MMFGAVPTCVVYDPAYAYEIAIIIQDGIRRMYQEGESRFYYITVYNENYAHPAMPDGIAEGVLAGIYRYRKADAGNATVQLFGSGSILGEALRAQQILAEKYQVNADVWSVTSYNQLRREALDVERWNRLNPDQPARVPYIVKALEDAEGPIIAASDYIKAVPDQLSPWLRERLVSLGTDGFGRSDNRKFLRRHFENDGESIAAAAVSKLAREGKIDAPKAKQAIIDLGLDPNSSDPSRK
jgi:pyruvate dehydrogenase E1 component